DADEEAMAYYKKALELKPDYTEANINLALLVLKPETAIVEEMNGLGTSAKDNRRYDELRDQINGLYHQAIPYLEKAHNERSKDIGIARTLMNLYGQVGEDAKFDSIKKKVDALEGN